MFLCAKNSIFLFQYPNLLRRGMMFCILIMSYLCVFSQESKIPLKINFSRQNNFTYSTQYDINWNKRYKKYRIELFSHHDNLANTVLEKPFVQVYFRNLIWQYYDFSPKWAAASWMESDQFLHNGTQRHSFYGGFSYKPLKTISITPLIGYSWDYLAKQLNQGFSPAFKVDIAHEWKEGLATQTRLFLREKYIYPRKQRNFSLNSMWNKSFGEFASLQFGVAAGSNEMDNFKQKSIEKIKSDTLNPLLQARYVFFKGLSIESENILLITRRKFDYKPNDTTEAEFNDLLFNQTEANSQQKIRYESPKIQAFLTYAYSFTNRRYLISNDLKLSSLAYEKLILQEEQKNFYRREHNWEANFVYLFHPKHTFLLNGNNKYVMYDTPSKTNFDDHDELSYGLSSEFQSKWNPRFSTRYKLLGNVRKYVFLFKERSQDNYTQPTLRLEFEYQWQILPRLFLKGEQFIYVVYNVKDFADINFTNRSTRNLESRLEIRYLQREKWQHSLNAYRKETHLSYLNWDKFAETTLDTTQNINIEQKNTYQLWTNDKKGTFFLDFGYKHFMLYRYQNTSMLNTQNMLKPINLHIHNVQTGAITGGRFLGTKGHSLECFVWWQYQHTSNKYYQISQFAGFNSNYKEVDLQKVSNKFRPFVDFRANVMF